MSQSVESFVVRAGPGIVGVVDGERCTLNACLNARLLSSRVVFNPIPSLSLVTPDPRHALLGGGLVVCTPKDRDGGHRMVRSRRGAETASKSGQSSVFQCVGNVRGIM